MHISLYGQRLMNISVQHHLPLSRTMRRSTIVLTVVGIEPTLLARTDF